MAGLKEPVRGNTLMELKCLTKAHYWGLFFSFGILSLGFYSSVKVTLTRKDTFARNQPYLEKKYGKIHREALGEDTKPSKYGYPDMGNNIYSDLLPYKDWVAMNNAQR